MKLVKKNVLMFMLTMLLTSIFCIQNIKADFDASGDSGIGKSIDTGSTYGMPNVGIKVTLLNSNGTKVGASKYYFPVNPGSSSGDLVVDVNHIVKFNRNTSARDGSGNTTILKCYDTNGKTATSDGCNIAAYLLAIVQNKDVNLVKFFIKEAYKDTSNSYGSINDINLSAYSSYYLKFEPFARIDYHTKVGGKPYQTYYVYGTPYEIMNFILKGPSASGIPSDRYSLGNGTTPYAGPTFIYNSGENNYYNGNWHNAYAPLESVYNIVQGIRSNKKLGSSFIPVYTNNAEFTYFNGLEKTSGLTWPKFNGIPKSPAWPSGWTYNYDQKKYVIKNFAKTLWYYYNKQGGAESTLSTQSGIGVGFIKINELVSETCESEFDGSDKSMAERIRIYEKYSSEGDYRNLLNMNITTGAKACTVKNNCNYIKQTSCLQVDLSRNYDDNDLSCYNEVIKSSGTNTPDAYCLVSFSLENKLGGNSFLTKSGSLIFSVKNNSTPGLAAQGVLKKRCYVKVNNVVDSKPYASYITGLEVEDGDKWMTLDADVDSNGTTVNKGFRTIKYTGKYLLKRLYGKGLTGMTTYENCSNCKFLGYGIVSKFNDNIIAQETGEVVSNLFGFKLFTNFSSYFPNIVEGSCRYFAVPELIKNGKIDLQFRIIDTANPFPGKLGEGRTTGANWCDELDCGFGNKIVKKIILNANNSYNKKQEFPKYEITLTPSDIKKIREYNKNRRYDDFDFTCDKDRINCTSNFLKKLSEGSLGLSNNLIMR